MAVLSAETWKAVERPEFTVSVQGGEVVLKRPDLSLLILEGVLPTPLLVEVIKLVGKWADSAPIKVTEDVMQNKEQILQFTDFLICNAAVAPRIVLSEEHAVDGAMWVGDITLQTKRVLVREILLRLAPPAVVAAARRFPDGRAGDGGGQDVQAVRLEAVGGGGA